MGILDLIKDIPPPPKSSPLTKDNASTSYAVKALTEAQNGNLRKLVTLANFDWNDSDEDSPKALALFKEAAFSKKPHWLEERVLKLVEKSTVENTLLLMDVLKVCPAFYIKVASKIVNLASTSSTSYMKRLKKLENDWRRGSDKTNQLHKEAKDFCILKAEELWRRHPQWRMNDMTERLKIELRGEKKLDPATDTIRGWLKTAQKDGILDIPVTASLPGRPEK